jgi:tetratricopeptide (TPR) repeat protein
VPLTASPSAKVCAVAIALHSVCLAQGQPSRSEEHYRRAREAQGRSDYVAAEKEWEAISLLEPRLAEAHSNLGMMRYLLRQYEPASRAFQKALELKPQLTSARLFLGITSYPI